MNSLKNWRFWEIKIRDARLSVDFVYNRIKYGVAERDTWNFDHYLATVLCRGLEVLEKDRHTWSPDLVIEDEKEKEEYMMGMFKGKYWSELTEEDKAEQESYNKEIVIKYEALMTELRSGFCEYIKEDPPFEDFPGNKKEQIQAYSVFMKERYGKLTRSLQILEKAFMGLWD